jgi:C-terminal processing protease CtpA/Prc
MFTKRLAIGTIWAALVWTGCASGRADKPSENKFYKNPQVRTCLRFDKDQRSSDAQACWTELLTRLEADPDFRTASELSDSDLAKIRQQVGKASGSSHGLRRKLDACYNLSSAQRDERMKCLQDYLAAYRERLSVAERFEVETAISTMQQAREQSAGNIENTIEHAGKLLGAKLHVEDEGIRIDTVESGPMAQAGCPEQGIIVALDDTPISEFDATERIARLEACQDQPVILLVRQGGAGLVTFTRVECRCGPQASGKQHWQVKIPGETCTTANAPELRLGLSWCYLAREGILEVEEVCKGSPADAAGVQREQQFIRINGEPILGKTNAQIADLLKAHPAEPLHFQARSGALESPAPLTGPPLEAERAAQFWQAVRRTVDTEDHSTKP